VFPGSDEQFQQWKHKLAELEFFGMVNSPPSLLLSCAPHSTDSNIGSNTQFLMTEIGHGSNVRNIETQVTYDVAAEVITNPSLH
jgi:hypothetical protein